MNNKEIRIIDCVDLSSKYGTTFIEFTTDSSLEFNQKIIESMLQVEKKYIEFKKDFLETARLDNSAINPRDPEWWHAYSINDRFKMHKEWNFLSFPSKAVKHLDDVVNEGLSVYLKMFYDIYKKKTPNYIHTWPVFCRKRRIAEAPHVHHFNPFNIAAVYYINGAFKPGNGELELYPDAKNPKEKKLYLPRSGRMIFFSANLPHAIGAYDGVVPRYSLGMDLWFKSEK
jgi:hypothetical protein